MHIFSVYQGHSDSGGNLLTDWKRTAMGRLWPKIKNQKNIRPKILRYPCLREKFEKEIWSLASLSCCSVTKQHFLVPFKAPAELSRGAIQQQGSAEKYSRSSPYHQGVLWQAAQQPSKNSWSLKKTSSYMLATKGLPRSPAFSIFYFNICCFWSGSTKLILKTNRKWLPQN